MRHRGRAAGDLVDQILVGKQSVGVAELMRLIHHQNPTGRGLGHAEVERRYRRKALLQSTLIERYCDDLEIRVYAEGVVALDHRLLDLDGCHAVIAELSDEARSKVRRALDIPKDRPSGLRPRSGAVPKSSAKGWRLELERGDQLLAEFDFDGAREAYENAWSSSGSAEPVTKLLELLVDHLADLDGARTFAQGLPEPVARMPNIRSLVAQAHAQLGNRREAERWLAGADDLRAGEVLAQLAQLALREGCYEQAAEDVAGAIRRNAASPIVQSARDAVVRAQAQDQQEVEADLQQSLRSEGLSEHLAKKAVRTLSRFPASRLAREVIARWASVEANTRALLRCETAARLAKEGKPALALLSLRGLFTDKLSPTTLQKVKALDVLLQQQADHAAMRARLDMAATAFHSPKRDVVPFLLLCQSERVQLLQELCADSKPALDLELAERMAGAHPKARAADVGRAVDAWRSWSAAMPSEAALDLLSPHEPLFQGVHVLETTLRDVRTSARAVQRIASLEAMKRMSSALAGARLKIADDARVQIVRESLESTELAALKALEERTDRMRHATQTFARITELAKSGDPRATELCGEALDTEVEESLRPVWAEHLSFARRCVDACYSVRRVESPALPPWRPATVVGLPPILRGRFNTVASSVVVPATEHEPGWFIAVEGYADCIALRFIGLASGKLERQIFLQLDGPALPLEVQVEGDHLCLLTPTVALRIRLADLAVTGRRDFPARNWVCMAGGERVLSGGSQPKLSWGGGAAWAREPNGARIKNLLHRRDDVRVPTEGTIVPIAKPGDNWTCARLAERFDGMSVFTDSGRVVPGVSFPLGTIALARHPSGVGFVGLRVDVTAGIPNKLGGEPSPPSKSYVFVTDDRGVQVCSAEIQLRVDGRPRIMVSTQDSFCVLVYNRLGEFGERVMAFSASRTRLEVSWEVDADLAGVIAGDRNGTCIYFLPATGEPPLRLTPTAPPPCRRCPLERLLLANLDHCNGFPGQLTAAAVRDRSQCQPGEPPSKWVRRLDPHARLAFLSIMSDAEESLSNGKLEEMLDWLDSAEATALGGWVVRAHYMAAQGEFRAAKEALERAQTKTIGAGFQAHTHHLAALLALWAGDNERAREESEKCRAMGQCNLAHLDYWIDVHTPSGSRSADPPTREVELARSYVALLHAADQHHEHGEIEASLQAVFQAEAISCRGDMQIEHRIARGALALQTPTPELEIERLLLLARAEEMEHVQLVSFLGPQQLPLRCRYSVAEEARAALVAHKRANRNAPFSPPPTCDSTP